MQSADYGDALEHMLGTDSLQKYNRIIDTNGKLAESQQIVERVLSEKSVLLESAKNQERPEELPLKTLVADLLVQLSSEQRGYNEKVAIQLNVIKSKVEILELEKKTLANQLLCSKTDRDDLRKQLEQSEKAKDKMISDWSTEKNRLTVQVNILTQTDKTASETISNLNTKLDQSRSELEHTSSELAKMTSNKNALQQKFDLLKESYEQLEKSINGPQQANKEKLYQEQIESLTKINARLTAEIEQSGKSNTNETPAPIPSTQLQEIANTDPQHLMQMYQKVRGKLNDNLQAMKSLTIQKQQLERDCGDKDDALSDLKRSLEDLKQDNTELSFIISEKSTAVSTLENDNDLLNQKITELSKENASLEASLKDTTKQLQHILANAESTGEEEDGSSFENTFKNVVELQSVNEALMSENRNLKHQLTQQTEKLNALENTVEEKHAYYKNTLAKSLESITLSQEENTRLHTKIAELEKNCEALKTLIDTLGKNNSAEIDAKWKEEVELFGTTQDRYKFFVTHAKNEMVLLHNQLKESRKAAVTATSNYASSKAEADYLRKVNADLNETVEKLEKRLKSASEQYELLQDQLSKTIHRLSKTKAEVSELTRKSELDDMNSHLHKTEMETMRKTREKLFKDFNKVLAEKSELTVLLDHTTKVLKENVAVKEKVIQDLGEKLSASEEALDLLRTQFKENNEKMERWEAIGPENLQVRCGELTTEAENLKLKLDEAEQKLSIESQEKFLALAKLSQAEIKLNAGEGYVTEEAITKHLETIAQTEEKNRQLQETVDAQNKAISEHEQKLADMKKEYEEKKAESSAVVEKILHTLEEKNLLSTAQLISTEETIRVLEQSLELVNLEKKKSLEEKQNLNEEIALLNQKVEEGVAKLQESQTKIDQYTEDLAIQLAELEEQKKINAEFEAKFDHLHQQYQTMEDEFCKDKDELTNGTYQRLTKVLSLKHSTQWKDAFQQIETENEKHRQKAASILQRIEKKIKETDDSASDQPEALSYFKSVAQNVCQLNQTLREEKESLFATLKARLVTIDELQTELFQSQYTVGEVTNRIAFLHERNKMVSLEQNREVQAQKNRADAFKDLYDEQLKENKALKAKINASDEDIVTKSSEINTLKEKIAGLENTLLQTQTDVQNLIETKEQLELRLAEEKEKQNAASSEELEAVKSELETTKGALEIAQNDFETTKTTLEATKTELETTKADLETAKTEKAELQAKYDETHANLTTTIQKANDRGRMALEFKKKATTMETKYTEAEEQIKTLKEQLAQKESTPAQPQDENTTTTTSTTDATDPATAIDNNSDSQLVEAQTQLAEYKARIEELEAKLGELENKSDTEKNDETNSELEETRAKLAESESKLAELVSKLAEAETKLVEAENKIGTSENTDTEANKQLLETQEKFAESEKRLEEMSSKLTKLETQLAESKSENSNTEAATTVEEEEGGEPEETDPEVKSKSDPINLKPENSDTEVLLVMSQKNLVETETKLSEVEAQLVASQTTCSLLENENKEFKDKVISLQKNIEEKDSSIKKLADDLESATNKITELESEVATQAKQEETQPASGDESEHKKTLEELQEKYNKVVEEHAQCAEKIQALEKEKKDTEVIKKKYALVVQKMRALVNEKNELTAKINAMTESKQPEAKTSQTEQPKEEEKETEQASPVSKKSPRMEEQDDPVGAPPSKKQHIEE